MSQETHLNYAPPPPLHRRRIWRRYLIAFAIVALSTTAYFWKSDIWRRMQIMYWQNQCMNYSAPPDRLVMNWDGSDKTPVDFNKPWNRFQALIDGGYITLPSDCAFMHCLARPDGKTRLICIYAVRNFVLADSAVSFYLRGDIYEPSSFGRMPVVLNSIRFDTPVRLESQIKVFAGQVDPANRSHFTIDYELDGHRKTIDGWLDNNDRLLLVERP